MNPLLEIMRQRIFMDHSADAKTFVDEEFTIRASIEGIDNVLIEKDAFLPNLHVFNSDGEELPVIKSELTVALYRGELIKEKDPKNIDRLKEFIHKLETKEVRLLWIKLPKKMKVNEVRVLHLKYDAKKEAKPRKTITVEYNKKLSHSVIYIIKKPEDYDLSNKPHIVYQNDLNETKVFDSWNHDKKSPLDVYQTYFTTSITIKPENLRSLLLRYSFFANRNVISFPLIAAGLLSTLAIFLLIMNHFSINYLVTDATLISLKNNHVQITFGIVAVSLVLPGLIRNNFIRNYFKFVFLIPLFIAIASILL